MEIIFHSSLNPNNMIATKFCMWQNSYAVMGGMCKTVAIWWPVTQLQQYIFSINFELWAKKVGPDLI